MIGKCQWLFRQTESVGIRDINLGVVTYELELCCDAPQNEAQASWRWEVIPLSSFLLGSGVFCMVLNKPNPRRFDVFIIHDVVHVAWSN